MNKKVEELNYQKQHYKNEIEKDDKAIKELSTEKGVERAARENYFMKKPNEDIYIIEYEDSIPKKSKNE